MTKEQKFNAFLETENGKMNAERFIKALTEKRLLCSVQHVSSSGMSRVIAMREVAINKEGQVQILQFDWFFEQMGFRYSEKHNGIVVKGCGMDMMFWAIQCMAGTLKARGFDVPEDYLRLADAYLCV